jgi:hypothetical protein
MTTDLDRVIRYLRAGPFADGLGLVQFGFALGRATTRSFGLELSAAVAQRMMLPARVCLMMMPLAPLASLRGCNQSPWIAGIVPLLATHGAETAIQVAAAGR